MNNVYYLTSSSLEPTPSPCACAATISPFDIDKQVWYQRVEAVFTNAYSNLRCFLFPRLPNSVDIDDVIQDSFLKVMELEAHDHILDLDKYITRVVANKAIDLCRAKQRSPITFQNELLYNDKVINRFPQQPDKIDPESSISSQQRLRALLEKFDTLPLNWRTALFLNKWQQKTNAEIAAIIGVSDTMVKRYIKKAVGHCRATLVESV